MSIYSKFWGLGCVSVASDPLLSEWGRARRRVIKVANDRTGTKLSWNSHGWSRSDSVVVCIYNIHRRQITIVVMATHYNDVSVVNRNSTTSKSMR